MINITLVNGANRNVLMVEEDSTIRSIFDNNGIDLTRGLVSLDGAVLKPGEITKTLRELGYDGTPGRDKAHLSSIVKADNAANVTIVGGAAVLESPYTIDQYQKVAKFNPEALSLYKGEGENKEEVFRVAIGKGHGSANQYGVTFGKTEDGKARVTTLLPEGLQDAKKWVSENWGSLILNLDKVEAAMDENLTAAQQNEDEINAHITVA